jgi:hypothetical protein
MIATATAATPAATAATPPRGSSPPARRRIERNLHDGAQQRLVSPALRLQAACAAQHPLKSTRLPDS